MRKKINSVDEIRETIFLLELEQTYKRELVKIEFLETYEKLKPVNLIKNKLKSVLADPDLKSNLLTTAMSIAAGYLTKKAVVGQTHNPLKKLFGTLLQIGVTRLVAKNSDAIKSTGQSVYQNLFNEKEQEHEHEQEQEQEI